MLIQLKFTEIDLTQLKIIVIDGALHAWTILALITKRLRAEWPELKIIFRGDSGFCRWKMLRWCDRNNVDYIIGLAKNSRLKAIGGKLINEAEALFEQTGEKQRLFAEFGYAAATWNRQRKSRPS